eukprot:31020-Pelagococcus_subviridis.AAC.11
MIPPLPPPAADHVHTYLLASLKLAQFLSNAPSAAGATGAAPREKKSFSAAGFAFFAGERAGSDAARSSNSNFPHEEKSGSGTRFHSRAQSCTLV